MGQLYTSGYLQTSFDNMLGLWHTANLSVSDLELLSPQRQLTVVLTEEVGAQDAIRIPSVSADYYFVFV